MNLEYVLKKPEGKQVEFKEEFPKGKKLAETVIAFSNQGGGTIYFGVQDEPREIIGFDNNQDLIELEERATNHIYDLVAPTPSFEITSQYLDEYDTHIMFVDVSPGKNKPYHFKDQPVEESTYLRVGSSNRKADEISLAELRRQSEGISYDQTPHGSGTISDLAEEVYQNFLKQRSQVRDLPKIDFSEKSLKQLKLITDSAGTTLPTVGGYLLFAEEPSQDFPQSVVRCARFKGTNTREIIDDKELDGPLFYLAEEVMQFFKRHINRGANIQGLQREEAYEYPKVAIREAIVNAICHRDYSVPGSEVKFAIFDDRIEITNPGGLPGRLSVEDLGKGISEIRNPVITRIFHQAGLIEKLGTGYQRIRSVLDEWGLPEPELRDTGTFFQITFRLKESLEVRLEGVELDMDEEKILATVKKEGSITLKDVQELIGKSKPTATKKLKSLVEKNLLRRVAQSSTDPTAYYELEQ